MVWEELFLGMALSPAKRARPASATSAMTWLFRSRDQSFRASAERNAWPEGIILEPGRCAALAMSSE